MSVTGDDPPYLSVGTEVSAKYKGAFCEAKIKKVQRCIKCRVTYKQGLGTATITDDQIKGQIRIGALIEAKYNDRKDFVEATINKIQDCSQYTVVFDDGDITTLRRSALCLKSGRHFAESETLDQLPLTHPEHFGYPVTGRRGRRCRQNQDGSSDEDDDDGARGSNDSGSGSGGKEGPEREPEIGKVVCVELSNDKKKKDNWFPGLIVSPNAQDTNKINVHEEFLVRSFRDSRFYTVPKKETTQFTKDMVAKVEHSILKTAVEKAIQYLDKDELPNHWDRDVLFGYAVTSDNTDSEEGDESPSSDDEPREEKDHVVATLYKFMDDRGTPINQCPMIGNEDIDLYKLFRAVYKLGGYNRVTNQNQWKSITKRLGFQVQNNQSTRNAVKHSYKRYLHSFEDFYRKLGCTMVNHPRSRTAKQRPGRSLIRDRDRTTTPNQEQPSIKIEKEEEEEKKPALIPEDEIKKEKIKKEIIPKEEEVQVKVKRKEEPADEDISGQESDTNLDVDDESSGSERSLRSISRLTPSSNVSGKSKVAVKNKDETLKKKPNAEKKKTDTKKLEKKDEKGKEDDSTKTRSRSKDDVSKGSKSSSETRETRAPSRESDKKLSIKPRRMTDDELKKRGRKKKDAEGEKGKSSEEQTMSFIPLYKGPVDIGDKLNVYYGPTHEKKVTYEAKIIDISKDGPEPLLLVHYTGWNNRYDEWIKCSRIAHNYSQSQGRSKRSKTTPRPQTPSVSSTSTPKSKTAPNAGTGSSPASQNRRRAQGDTSSTGSGSSICNRDARKDEREVTPTTRSMTPSPLISNVLRTKSPASTASNRSTRATRNADSASSSDLSRRPRRSSGHTDTIAAEETESDETDSLESDASISTQITSRSRVRGVQEKRNRREARRRAESRMKIEDVSDTEEKEIEEPRRGRRIRKSIGKMLEIKSEPESDDEQPKGRDFDLNQIRSELKGFDKAVKLEITAVERVVEDQESSVITKQEKSEQESILDKKIDLESEKKREIPKVEQQIGTPVKREISKVDPSQPDSTEDIYEFKEPEPFEFEVRNKRDSGGSGNSTDKEKDKEKDKPKSKQRPFEEDLKSPKKRTKPPFNPTNTSPAKVEQKSPIENNPADQTADIKKKVRKIFKKNDETEETTETENEEAPLISLREPTKFYCSATYSNMMGYRRKGNFTANATRPDENSTDESTSAADSIIERVATGDDSVKNPKKRQPKTFGSAAAAAAAVTKANEIKREISPMDSAEAKKKARKVFGKIPDDAGDNDEEDDSNKELAKFFPNLSGTKAPRKDVLANKASVETDNTDESVNPKRPVEDDSVKGVKKRQKIVGTVATKIDANFAETPDAKKRVVRKVTNKKLGDADSVGNESDESEEPVRDHVKYVSHYSGPKGKAGSLATEIESAQDKHAVPKADAQVTEPPKAFVLSSSVQSNVSKDDGKSKLVEPTAPITTSSGTDSKQGPSVVEKKRVGDVNTPMKTETKTEIKSLDFTPIVPQLLTVPAPLSARLPATASIEEKLSAAAVFRSKMKDAKRDDDAEILPRKSFKDVMKKTDTLSAKKAQKEKEESKVKYEPPEKKKQQTNMEQVVVNKDPLTEIEVRKDPLLEVIKTKDDDLLKIKKDFEPKTSLTSVIPIITKTYGNQRKEPLRKPEEVWKKAAAMVASSIASNEGVSSSSSTIESTKDYSSARKEAIVNKIKSTIDRDSMDSTDSSDSERRLTIIDNEDFTDDKGNESGPDTMRTKATVISAPINQFNNMSLQQEIKNVICNIEAPQQQVIGIIGNSVIQGKSTKTEEDGENLNSLLCEEEIPGSPTPGGEAVEQEQRSATMQNLAKSDIGSKVAVAFVAAQLPLSTVPPPTQLSNCTLVTTMSGGMPVPQNSRHIVPVPMSIQHLNLQSIRQTLIQPQLQPPQQSMPPQMHQSHHPHHNLQQQQQQQQQQHQPSNQVSMALQQRRESNETNPAMENTPPTTPDSSTSNMSNSPRNERTGGSMLSSSEDNSSKMHRDSSEAENDGINSKPSGGGSSRSSAIVNPEMRGNAIASTSSSERVTKTPPKRIVNDNDGATSPKKRKKRKDQDMSSGMLSYTGPGNSMASGKKSPRQSSLRNARHGSDSDDDQNESLSSMYVNSNTTMTLHSSNMAGGAMTNGGAISSTMNPPVAASAVIHAIPNIGCQSWNWSYTPKSKYKLLPELDPGWSSDERIEILNKKISEARKIYAEEQANLAKYEKCMKKMKRKRREEQRALERAMSAV
ncbi:AT-rich interactive domain-containing protein 4B isoform X2 [Copidosoma floridanum]|uniref:AT-rich interactive domain-containing protein 4B isoform X2 n=1 Tax=Copidosoma floridanum TaxID=29053 RepID=UPI0006C99586|nr:AT-rich interactive domain-containing protein 4B isoform X2 [Copidosoma floridanum]